MRVRVVGAGFSGLVTAYFLVKEGCEVELYEAAPAPGGLIQSTRVAHGLIETAANGVLNSALFESICRDIGVSVQPARRSSRKRYIWRGDRPRRWPLSVFETLGMLGRLVWAGLRGRSPEPGETIAQWGERVLGRPAVKHLLAPALQGIYAGDHRRLSATLILGRFFGGHRRLVNKPNLRGTVAPMNGMGEFAAKMRLWLEGRGVAFRLAHQVSPQEFVSWSEKRVVALSAPAAATLLSKLDVELSDRLSKIEMIPVTTVTLFFPKEAGKREGFGCLFPRGEGFEVLGVLMNTFIFDNRGESHSETWIFRGTNESDSTLLERIATERRRFYGEDVWPLEWKITRWPQALPHYTVELERELPTIQALAGKYDFHLIGNYLGRLSLARICESAAELAASVSGKTSRKTHA